MMVDGDLRLAMSSGNGTWLCLNEDFEVYSGMVFKSNATVFRAILM